MSSWRRKIRAHPYAYYAVAGVVVVGILALAGRMPWWGAILAWAFWTGMMWLFLWCATYNGRRPQVRER